MIVKASTFTCPKVARGFVKGIDHPFFYEMNLHKSVMILLETDDVTSMEIDQAEKIEIYNFTYTRRKSDDYSGIGNTIYNGKEYAVELTDTVKY